MSYKIKADFDPHTPLRVDMREATEEDHRKVQEIFFALEYFWLSQHGEPPRTYPPHPELNYYTNCNITQPGEYLRWLSKNKHNLPTLTPQEFYDLVLETETTLNLTKEHERKRFKTRRGNPVVVVHVETELDVTHPVIGFELYEGRWTLATWHLTGKSFRESESVFDLVEEYTPVFEHWDMLSTSIVTIAKNANGSWHGFTEVPQKDNYRWSPGGGSHFPLCFLNVQFPECDWEDSLIVRPNND